MLAVSHPEFDDSTFSTATLLYVRCKKKKLIDQSRLFQQTYLFMPLGPMTPPLAQAAAVACLYARQTPLLRFSDFC
jgi:hypothetical protein